MVASGLRVGAEDLRATTLDARGTACCSSMAWKRSVAHDIHALGRAPAGLTGRIRIRILAPTPRFKV